MNTQHSTHPDQLSAVEFLARQSHLSVGDVDQLYADEMARLAVGARIKSFLSIIAIRNIRELLLDRANVKLAPA